MKGTGRVRWKIDAFLLLVALPLVGVSVAGRPLTGYLEFPPLTRYVQHAPFSWPAFTALALLILVVVAPFVTRVVMSRRPETVPARRGYPWWGVAGTGLMLVAWFLAWTRFPWFARFQMFTFSPIWLGYILAVNGLSYRRTGHCLLRDRPRYFLTLFAVSALFWWYFEYLNRFVQNWYYVGVEDLSRWEYVVFATLPFSTVLPAVLSTRELLATAPGLSRGLDNFVRLRVRWPRIAAWAWLLAACAGLCAVGIEPDYFFPLLWVAPLVVFTALQSIRGEQTIFSDLAGGNWTNVCLLALSALVCGFFWELWNTHSLARWIYAVPFVGRFRIFEMPLLGYAGYLPFGLECAVVADIATTRTSAGRRP